MATYVVLLNWTDEGIRNYKGTLDRAKAFGELIEEFGGKIKEIYWTIGPYDIVVIAEAPDEESMTAAMLALTSRGTTRSTTLRAFDAEEMAGIIQKAG